VLIEIHIGQGEKCGVDGEMGKFAGNRLQQEMADSGSMQIMVKTCHVENKLFQYRLFVVEGNLLFF
jgi:hypothetical protein